MDAVHAPLLDAVGTLLLAEAGGVGGEGLGQLGFGDDLVDKLADHGVFTGTDEVQVLPLDFIHHGVHIGLAHDALHHIAVDHEGGDAEGEALADHKVPGIGQHRFVEPGHIAQQVVEAAARDTAGGVHVYTIKALHNIDVIGDLVVGHHRLTKALDLHVGGVIGADGYGVVNDLGNDQHDLPNFLGQLGLLLLQLGQPVGVGLHLGLGLLSLGQLGGVLLGLAHQHAHLLGKGVALGPQILSGLNGVAVFLVQSNDLVHQRKLCVLELLFDVFLDDLGVFTNESNIQHGKSPHNKFCGFL